MVEPARKRMILRRERGSAVPGRDLARILDRDRAVAIIDEGDELLLVEGEESALDRVIGNLDGWTAHPFNTVPRPDARPRVLKAPHR